MLKQAAQSLQYGDAATAAMLLFCVAFALICYSTLRLSRRSTDRYASIALTDRVEDPRA